MKKQTVRQSILFITMIMCLAITACGSSSNSDDGPVPATKTIAGKVLGLNASNGDYSDKIRIEWEAYEGASSYTLHTSDQEDGDYRVYERKIITTYFEDTNIITDKIYYYKVSASISDANTDLSDSTAGNAHDGPPGIPENVSATDGRFENKIVITWTRPDSGASIYEVHRAETEAGDYSKIAEVMFTGTDPLKYEDYDPMVFNQDYFYKVKSITIQGESDLSNADIGQIEEGPEGPSNVSASDGIYSDKILVQWDASEKALFYKVYRADDIAGEYTVIAEVESTDPFSPKYKYNDTPVTLDQVYYYKVQTIFDDRDSRLSEAEEGYSHENEVDTPENVSASDGEENVISVTWDLVSGDNITYEVLRQGPDLGEFLLVATGLSESPYTDNEIEPCTPYSYQVKAKSVDFTSYPGSDDGGYAKAITPEELPTNLTATDNSSQLVVSWDTITGDSITYKLYRSEWNAPFTELAEVPQPEGTAVATFIDTTASVDIDYLYKVSAVSYGCSESDLSDPVRGYIPVIFPTPEGLTLVVIDKKGWPYHHYGAEISWAEVPGAGYYLIQRAENSGDNNWSDWEDIATVNGTPPECSYSDWEPKINDHVRYRVKAFDEDSGIDGSFCSPEEIIIE